MIQTVKQRAALAPRRNPYFVSMGKGRHIGYRRTEDGGTWIARSYDDGTRGYSFNSLGDLAGTPGSDQFGAAQKLAREWFEHLDGGGTTERATVRQACARYVVALANRGKRNSARQAKLTEGWFAANVDADPIAGIELGKLKGAHVGDWRVRFEAKPCHAQSANSAPKEKTKGTLNRGIAMLRAALNLARTDGLVTADVWKPKLSRHKDADNARKLYLSRADREALLRQMDAEAFPFFHALCLLPIRPGALAAVTVGDFDAKSRKLLIREDKSGAGRTIKLPPVTAAFFQAQSRLKLPGARLFARADGTEWNWDGWRYPMRTAAAAAGLPADATTYSIRHATISDLIHDGVSIYSVAKMAGTSVAMIEKYYGKVSDQLCEDALARLALAA